MRTCDICNTCEHSAKPMTAISPRGIKAVISKFAPQFAGFQQHDAQELLCFVLVSCSIDISAANSQRIAAGCDILACMPSAYAVIACLNGFHFIFHRTVFTKDSIECWLGNAILIPRCVVCLLVCFD